MSKQLQQAIKQVKESLEDKATIPEYKITSKVMESSDNAFTQQLRRQAAAKTEKKSLIYGGGIFSDTVDTLLASNYGSAATARRVLKSQGIIEDEGNSWTDDFKSRITYDDVLIDIGNTTGKGGVLTGQYEAKKNVWYNFVRELPRASLALTLDIVLDPTSWLGWMGVTAKGFSRVGREISKIAGKVPDEVSILGRSFEPKVVSRKVAQKVLPPSLFVPDEIQKLGKMKQYARKEGYKEAAAAVAKVEKMPSSLQKRISQIVRGGITTKKELADLAAPIRKLLDDKQQEISKIAPELLSEELVASKKGNYLGIVYATKKFPGEFDDVAPTMKIGKVDIKIPTGRLKKIKNFANKVPQRVRDFFDLSVDKRRRIKLIMNDNFFQNEMKKYPQGLTTDIEKAEAVKNLTQAFPEGDRVVTAIEIDSFLKRNSDLITKGEFINQPTGVNFEKFYNQKIRKKLGEIEEISIRAVSTIADQNEIINQVKYFDELSKTKYVSNVPTNTHTEFIKKIKEMGALSGKYITPDLANELKRTFKFETQLESIWLKGLRLWKAGKTAYNPATIGRNAITNLFILNPLGGVQWWRADLYQKATKELTQQGDLFKRAEKVGLSFSSYEVSELATKSNSLYKRIIKEGDGDKIKEFADNAKDFHEKVLNFYGAQDRYFKLANFIKGVTEDGLDDWGAMQRANFYLIDYSDMPEAVDFLRNSPVGIPFLSFSYGVTRPIAKTMVTQPHKISNYFKVLNAIRSLNPYQISEEDRKKLNGDLPEFLRNKPKVRVPWKDKFGNVQFLDLEYILPFNIFEMDTFMPGGPVLDIVVALTTNRDSFTGSKIIEDGSTTLDAWATSSKFVYDNLVPPLLGYSGQSIYESITGVPQRLSETPRSFTSAITSNVLGLRTYPINPEVAERQSGIWLKGKINDIRGKMWKANFDRKKGFIDTEQYKDRMLELRRRIDKIMSNEG